MIQCPSCGNTDLLPKFKCCPECGSPLPRASDVPRKEEGVAQKTAELGDAGINRDLAVEKRQIQGTCG